MDDAVKRRVRELAEAIDAAVSRDPAVRECRLRAREAGVDVEVTLEAVVRVTGLHAAGAHARVATPPSRMLPAARSLSMTEADKRFLRSLRIAVGETAGEEL